MATMATTLICSVLLATVLVLDFPRLTQGQSAACKANLANLYNYRSGPKNPKPSGRKQMETILKRPITQKFMDTQGNPYTGTCRQSRRLLQSAWTGTIESYFTECLPTEGDQGCDDCLDSLNVGSTVYDLLPVTYMVGDTSTPGNAWCAAAAAYDDPDNNCTLCFFDFV